MEVNSGLRKLFVLAVAHLISTAGYSVLDTIHILLCNSLRLLRVRSSPVLLATTCHTHYANTGCWCVWSNEKYVEGPSPPSQEGMTPIYSTVSPFDVVRCGM